MKVLCIEYYFFAFFYYLLQNSDKHAEKLTNLISKLFLASKKKRKEIKKSLESLKNLISREDACV